MEFAALNILWCEEKFKSKMAAPKYHKIHYRYMKSLIIMLYPPNLPGYVYFIIDIDGILCRQAFDPMNIHIDRSITLTMVPLDSFCIWCLNLGFQV